jgi:CCR4-NOT transcriptional regulation complex NOT5 subunit
MSKKVMIKMFAEQIPFTIEECEKMNAFVRKLLSKEQIKTMKQKLTSLAQLKENIELLPKLEAVRDYTRGHMDCRRLIIDLIDKLLAEEKQMVINAFTKAYLIGEDEINSIDAEKAATAYFNQNYKQ